MKWQWNRTEKRFTCWALRSTSACFLCCCFFWALPLLALHQAALRAFMTAFRQGGEIGTWGYFILEVWVPDAAEQLVLYAALNLDGRSSGKHKCQWFRKIQYPRRINRALTSESYLSAFFWRASDATFFRKAISCHWCLDFGFASVESSLTNWHNLEVFNPVSLSVITRAWRFL